MFDLNVLLAAAGGGIFGAALGGVPAFVFTGLMVLVGIAAGFSVPLKQQQYSTRSPLVPSLDLTLLSVAGLLRPPMLLKKASTRAARTLPPA